ncbi:hypothetical protein HUK80_13030 [Flavobacterium sp. MAH-1]|uniref:Uncharacterized protein n=1 Tax=Flavobacterium agri TaxID=2743471 RepID=A0A7Y8Y4P6_9FLAO|nr:hypothetical protein [Flavobacterium agri]NUY81824.1 hypothetical protein [Flavobacterium agri]NYA71848.1 hypothetical protein [Flavobacterium agri]
MIYVLLFTIIALLAVIVLQMRLINRSRHEHEQKMEVLRRVIVELAGNSALKNQQLQLSDELMKRLRSANTVLSRDITVLVNEFVETLSAHNLLK